MKVKFTEAELLRFEYQDLIELLQKAQKVYDIRRCKKKVSCIRENNHEGDCQSYAGL